MESILEQKLALLTDMLTLTQAERFTGTQAALDDEAARYISLYEKRIGLLNKIKDIDRRLEAEPAVRDDDPVAQEIKRTIQRLLQCDEANAKTAQVLMAHVKNGMKELRLGKEACLRYQTEYTTDAGMHYDSRN